MDNKISENYITFRINFYEERKITQIYYIFKYFSIQFYINQVQSYYAIILIYQLRLIDNINILRHIEYDNCRGIVKYFQKGKKHNPNEIYNQNVQKKYNKGKIIVKRNPMHRSIIIPEFKVKLTLLKYCIYINCSIYLLMFFVIYWLIQILDMMDVYSRASPRGILINKIKIFTAYSMFQYNNHLSFFYGSYVKQYEGSQLQSQMMLPMLINLQNQQMQAQYLQSQLLRTMQYPFSQKQNTEEQALIKQKDIVAAPEEQFEKVKSIQVIAKQKIHKKKRRNAKKFYNQGHWTSKEHRQYLAFILQRKEVILQPDLKREQQVFKSMSMIIKTRTAAQCRSHHQKFDFMSYLNQDCPTGDDSK
ncbi:hypothetical protein pb186bvf_016611 [Paramecium bursaria]